MGLFSGHVPGGKIERGKADITADFAQMAVKIVETHHEHLNGSEIAMREPALPEFWQRAEVDPKEGRELPVEPAQWSQSMNG